MTTPCIHPSWLEALGAEFGAEYMTRLRSFLVSEIEAGQKVFPPGPEIFAAFDLCPLDQVRVVVIGQDPYHGPGQAHGLSFSVAPGVRQPPSLQNIFKELRAEYPDFVIPTSGDLRPWARQGVLLLNATLTVRAGQPTSHAGRGWEIFTDAVIRAVSDRREHVAFLLWGNFARGKKSLIDASKHAVLEAAHPSPFSAHSGFFGCGHFRRANEILASWGMPEVDWRLP